MPVGTSIRIYDLAKDLKQDTKRVIEELRLEGADVSVPSHSVSKELAERLRNKYFPKAEAAPAPKRIIRVFPRKPTVESSANDFPLEESKVNLVKTQPQVEEKIPESSLTIIENKLKELPIEIPINSQKETSSNKLIDELKVDCRECLRPTKHNLIHSVEVKELEWNEKYQIVQCMGCESLSFRRITFKNNQSNDKEEIHLYPSRIKGRQKLQLESIPPTIAQIYEEIHLAISNRLLIVATTGMRTLIELVCNDLNSTAGNLKGKIDDLVRRQLLTPKNANNLHKLRDFGNNAAHEANIQSENTLNRCIDIIEHLLKDIYSPEISS
ncbi:MAG: translation initiation factor IF-2 N-terminal domain-containing protein [Acidobacteria bacterium]|jgi:hypothetical protein|nr:translation initiation factor IF-2 N-terminal domain-containing protein [Acidobacteriota bacterium]